MPAAALHSSHRRARGPSISLSPHQRRDSPCQFSQRKRHAEAECAGSRAPAHHQPSARLPVAGSIGSIARQDALLTQCGGYLEASDVEDEGEIPSNVIAAIARSGRLRTAITERSYDATSTASPLAAIASAPLRAGRTVEQILGEPPPRPLPQSLRIYCQRIERGRPVNQSRRRPGRTGYETARRAEIFRLNPRSPKPRRIPAALRGGERNRIRWKGAPIQRLHMLHLSTKTRICPVRSKRPLRLGPYRCHTKSMKARTFAAGKWRDGLKCI